MARRPWRSTLSAVATLGIVAGCGLPVQPGVKSADVRWLEASFATGKKSAVVAVEYGNSANLTRLAEAGMDVWGVDEPARKAYGTLGPNQVGVLKSLGLSARPAPANFNTFNNFDKGYHTYDTMLAELKSLVAKAGEIAELVDLGPTYETLKGKADRRIWAVHIRKGDASGKPGVVFLGNHHAREIVTPEICLNIARMLVEGYGKDAEMTSAVDGRDIWIVPMVNPDGHARAAKGDDWRKNTDPETSLVSAFWGAYGPGVDLNRNYTYHWGEGGASTQPDDPTYRGRAAGSEPEVQAVMKLVSSRKFTYLMTYHSFSNLILWPWGYTDDPPPDDRLPAIGKVLGKLSGYKPQQSKDLYRTSGDTTDWAFGTQGILSYTTEIGSWGDGFDPPYSRVAKFWQENEPGARYLLKTADNPGAVFGPEVRILPDGRVEAPRGAMVEAHVDRVGPESTGIRINGRLPQMAGRRLVYVRARIGNGPWGPAEVAWSR